MLKEPVSRTSQKLGVSPVRILFFTPHVIRNFCARVIIRVRLRSRTHPLLHSQMTLVGLPSSFIHKTQHGYDAALSNCLWPLKTQVQVSLNPYPLNHEFNMFVFNSDWSMILIIDFLIVIILVRFATSIIKVSHLTGGQVTVWVVFQPISVTTICSYHTDSLRWYLKLIFLSGRFTHSRFSRCPKDTAVSLSRFLTDFITSPVTLFITVMADIIWLSLTGSILRPIRMTLRLFFSLPDLCQ